MDADRDAHDLVSSKNRENFGDIGIAPWTAPALEFLLAVGAVNRVIDLDWLLGPAPIFGPITPNGWATNIEAHRMIGELAWVPVSSM